MSGWQNSHSTNTRHEHVTRRESTGRDVCLTCGRVVIKPIVNPDDERLVDAGLMRSDDRDDQFIAPLPEQLIACYEQTQGDFPVAPYVIQVMSINQDSDDSLWRRLADLV